MRVKTESGSLYEFEDGKIRRTNEDADLRRDNEWLAVQLPDPRGPQIGQSMLIGLEPLGEGNITFRRTSRVVEILDD